MKQNWKVVDLNMKKKPESVFSLKANTKTGSISLSADVVNKLGTPKYVQLLESHEEQLIALRAGKDENASVRIFVNEPKPGNATFFSKAFASWLAKKLDAPDTNITLIGQPEGSDKIAFDLTQAKLVAVTTRAKKDPKDQ